MHPLKLTSLCFLVMTILFLQCKEEELELKKRKITFAQIENNPKAIATTKEVILSATIHDIEDENLKPTPKPVVEYGHIYSTDQNALINLSITHLGELDATIFSKKQGGSLFSEERNNTGSKKYNTLIPAEELEEGEKYYFLAYVVRPSNGKLKLSEISQQEFKVPTIGIDTKFPLDSIIENEMKVRAIGEISEANNIFIYEYGHRLLNVNDPDDENPIDSSKTIIENPEAFSGELSFTNEIQIFDVNTTYYIQAYVKYCKEENCNDTIIERDNNLDNVSITFNPAQGLWINTAKLKKKNGAQNSVDPPKLEDAVSFVLNGYAYIGLGRDSMGAYNEKFWKFDPNSYTWTEMTDFSFPMSQLRINTVFFTLNNYAYVGMGDKGDGNNKIYYTDFYKTDFESTSSWDEATPILKFNDFKEELINGMNTELANAPVTFSNDANNIDEWRELFYRNGPFSYSNDNGAFWGGGIGKEIKRITYNSIKEFPTLDIGVGEEKDWNDFNGNGKIDWGHWVDKNGDGVIDAGVLSSDEPKGINIDDDDDIEVNLFMEEEYKIMINNSNGNMIKVTIKPLSSTTENELMSASYDQNPTLKRAEWLDLSFDKKISLDEINLDYAIKSDLWQIINDANNNAEAELIKYTDDAFLRDGGIAFSPSGIGFLFGGAKNETDFASNYKVDNSDNDSVEMIDISSLKSLFGLSFIIDGKIYFGGGEDHSGVPQGLNLKIFDPSSPTNITNAEGCGLTNLTRGVAFSINRKGFIGIGRTRTGPDGLKDELWMYIPGE